MPGPNAPMPKIDLSKIGPTPATLRAPGIKDGYSDFEFGKMIYANVGTDLSTMAVGGTTRIILLKFAGQTAVQVGVNGKNADMFDAAWNSWCPYGYLNVWVTAAIDLKPWSGDARPKVAFVNKEFRSVMLDVYLNHAFYGLKKIPIGAKPGDKFTPLQGVINGTANSLAKALVRKDLLKAWPLRRLEMLLRAPGRRRPMTYHCLISVRVMEPAVAGSIGVLIHI